MSQWLPVLDESFISREQFGLTLYAAIRCCGAILQIGEHMACDPQQRQYAADLITAKRQLAMALKVLTDDETGQLLAHYPFIPKL